MKNTVIEQLEKQIREEAGQRRARLEELNRLILEDQEILDTYEERFTKAVQDFAGEEELSKLQAQRNEALKRVEQSKNIFKIISADGEGSKIRRLNAELVGEYLKAAEVLEKKAREKYEKIKVHRDSLVNGVKELLELHMEIMPYMRRIDTLIMDRGDAEKYGLQGMRVCDGQKSIVNDTDRAFKILNLAKQMEFSLHNITYNADGTRNHDYWV